MVGRFVYPNYPLPFKGIFHLPWAGNLRQLLAADTAAEFDFKWTKEYGNAFAIKGSMGVRDSIIFEPNYQKIESLKAWNAVSNWPQGKEKLHPPQSVRPYFPFYTQALHYILNTTGYTYPKPQQSRATTRLIVGEGLVYAHGLYIISRLVMLCYVRFQVTNMLNNASWWIPPFRLRCFRTFSIFSC